MKNSKTIIVSAVNLVEGGGLSILKKCVQEFSTFNKDNKYTIYILVHSISLLPEYKNITYIAYPKAKKNWLFRAFYEYIYFYFLSLKYQPIVWLSLHDITPNVRVKYLYTYMHNSSPFFKKPKGLKLNWKFNLFVIFYRYLYCLNVKKTTACIVQQNWFRYKISELCKQPKEKIIVAKPENEKKLLSSYDGKFQKNQFFFNSYPRDFKNFEIICKASDILNRDRELIDDWNIFLTIDGSENKYSHNIVEKYKCDKHLHFLGLLTRDECEEYYRSSECLIFPSLLETWGLPISEYKLYEKKMILADLPYAYEAASGAKQVSFFDPLNEMQLAEIIKSVITNQESPVFNQVAQLEIEEPYCKNWEELINKIIHAE
ncbi:MAG: glycosyltransferase [Treponema sp.]|nr:glycosyltransferase [Treponema sp.]